MLITCLLAACGSLTRNKETGDFRELSKILQQNFAKDFDFSVLIKVGHDIEFTENFGYMDKERLNPVNEKTLFNIASVTKSITAVGIMKLVEQNEINLSDTLGRFFENVPEPKKSISISTLLSHKSGLKQTYPLDGISESDEALQTIWNERLELSLTVAFYIPIRIINCWH